MSFLNVLKTGKCSGIAKGVLGCLAAGTIFFGVSSVATNAGNENARREIVERSVTQSYIADNAEAVGISVAEGEQPVLEQVLDNKTSYSSNTRLPMPHYRTLADAQTQAERQRTVTERNTH